MQIERLVEFAKKHHEGLGALPRDFLRKFFAKYADWTLIARQSERIVGFCVYQDFGDTLNVIAICNIGEVKWMLKLRKYNQGKRVVYFDEEKMELRVLCHR